MGKTARWLRGLLSRKKSPPVPTSDPKPAKEKKRWGFVKSFREKETAVGHAGEYHRRGSYREEASSCSSPYVVDGVEQNKHAIAVAAATAAVAEAAVAAANAAAAVVRLTSSGRCAFSGGGGRKDWAAVKVQSAFRGYLARRALKALKGLVKLQALVRGHLVRKQAVDMLRYMQAIQRVQARARAGRSQILETRQHTKGPHRHPDPATPEKYESGFRPSSTKHEKSSPLKRAASKSRKKEHNEMDRTHCNSNRLDQWMDERSWDLRETPTKSGTADDEKSDKILEVDTVKPHVNSNRGNTHLQQSSHCSLNSYSFTTLPDSPSKDSTTAQHSFPSPSSVEMQSPSPLIFPLTVEDTADSSPHFYSASSRPGSARRGPFTPPKSDCSRSFISGYSDYPNYMANTESSRAKVRSHSAPKQRPEFEKSSSTKRLSVQGVVDGRVTAGWGGAWTQRSSSLRSKFTSKAYPGSGRLDRLGMPIQEAMGNSDDNAGRC